MNLQKLSVFVTLVETRKMTETAAKLQLTAPTVSFHIRSLEKEYHMRLFRTNAGGYRLTSGGEVLYHYAKQLIQTNRAMERSMRDIREGMSGSIRLGASGVPAQLYMPDLIHRLTERYPRVKVSLDVKTAPEIEARLATQELDFGLVMETEHKQEELTYEELTSDKLVLAFSKEHHLKDKADWGIDDLHRETLLVHNLSSSTGHFSRTWLVEKEMEMEKIELDSVSTITKMLSFGKSVALISKRLIEKELNLSYKELHDSSLERRIFFVYHRDLWFSEPFRHFQELVREQAKVLDSR
ncbi:DNA-binding transcriptional regulator, LysR family [Terribacillus halophilus]|uniref:DNA-binding transcriptional regulator, LysR family n=1 Tax=Terribacillus halophilus TaxID=361279 RepID=A0A1G6KWK5_9BACI|nr:LysR family transcriptional regulator [Terribacillus halophilus]SDC35470.1 DNA-binding transcriptional regulator, LysR family [Terribacillus halophilus]